MAYCTVVQVQSAKTAKILQNQTDDTKAATIDTDIIDAAILNADNEIDGYLRTAGIAVPISPVPGSINRYSIKITVYNLYGRSHVTPKSATKDYDDTIKALKDIADGEMIIDATTEKALFDTARIYDTPKFNDDTLS